MPVHTYTNWNSRPSDREEQVEPYRKYYFICEGANTETFYFEKLIDLRKDLGDTPIDRHQTVGEDRRRSKHFVAKNLVRFAYEQKSLESNGFDVERDKMIIVFDGDIFEEKVQGYDELIKQYGVLNPLIVRPVPDGVYEIISGHRRKYAAQQLGYRKVPVIIRVMNDEEFLFCSMEALSFRSRISSIRH